MKLKICGIMDLLTLKACDELGVDYIGFVFAKSRRQISLVDAVMLKQQAELKHSKVVAVFKDMSSSGIETIISCLEPDYIQLHDLLSVDFPENRTIQARAHHEPFDSEVCHLLIDSSQAGSGKTFDWSCLETLQNHSSLWIAGGLNRDNLPELFKIIRPYAVDVSSGAETDGQKDILKIIQLKQLIQEVNNGI